MNLLDLDKRWQRFNDANRECPCCGQTYGGVFDIGFDHPLTWPHENRADSGQEVIEKDDDKLSADLCRVGDDRFIRCIVALPIRGSDETFAFGAWGSVHPDHFAAYVQAWNSGDWSGFEGCFSWLSNDLPGFESEEPIACNLWIGEPGERPALQAQGGPLKEAQENGISFDDLLDIYAATGNDIRAHLTSD
ncbi:DUF2199 domain-containing protein [Actibacterium pelagium]|uniref:DUF2199 domain-containing protein n=1 Tax=Actibacterium pelagium TaxID=2029103 RepID=A0A917AFA0_9RHOB|nr:DUF2199 domain-containing protein [Actibacterium pelagium]GGE46215.1 hypothetical protein GCM10011517_12390 [Actibacterium pelagium]